MSTWTLTQQARVMHIVSFIILGLTFIALFIYGYLALWPMRTMEIKETRLMQATVHAGDQFQYEIDYCKFINTPAVNYRSIVDGFIVNMTPETSSSPKGCATKIVTIDVPDFLPIGRYYIHTDIIYHINAIRTETVSYRTEEFLVVER